MLTRTLFPILTLALAGSLVLACGSPERIFYDGGTGGSGGTTGSGGKGGTPMDGSAGSGGDTDASTADQESEPTVDDGAMVDSSPTDASIDARGDAASDGRGDALTDGGRADLVPSDIVVNDTVGDTAVNDISVSDAGSDAPVDGGGTPDINSDILDCSGTPVPRISPTGAIGVCPGKTITLTSTSAVSYLWSNAATTQSVDVPAGSYTVTTTDARGCIATSTPSVVSTYPTPTTPTITAGGPTRFCNGGSVTLSSSPGSSYAWSNGATTQSVVIAASGSYSVTTTDANGCTAISAPTTVTAVVPGTGSRTFGYVGVAEGFVIPECVTSVTIEAYGAQGGPSNSLGMGGYGGLLNARLNVQPAATLQVRVGGAGSLCTTDNTGGFNGGGIANCNGYSGTMWFYSGTGGGATDVRVSPFTLDDRVLVAGGGGGAGYNSCSVDDSGGVGGGSTGGQYQSTCPSPASAGAGGTQTGGGLGGTYPGGYWGSAGNGAYALGGSGYSTGGSNALEGGGGGGGYFGGGGGCWIGGGGGSDYLRTTIGTLLSQTPGTRAGHGALILTY
jgi:hypothetical protein